MVTVPTIVATTTADDDSHSGDEDSNDVDDDCFSTRWELPVRTGKGLWGDKLDWRGKIAKELLEPGHILPPASTGCCPHADQVLITTLIIISNNNNNNIKLMVFS